MSFHTDTSHYHRLQKLSRRAQRRAGFAKLVGYLAAIGGMITLLFFLAQSGLFTGWFPDQNNLVAEAPATAEIRGIDAEINGFDHEGHPFSVTAQSAKQDSENPKLIHLIKPTGQFNRGTGQTINLSAANGRYDTETKILELGGDVVFAQSGSYKVNMQKAELNLVDFTMLSKSPVQVEMGTNRVEADRLEISENGKKTLFSGHVKAKLISDIESEIVP